MPLSVEFQVISPESTQTHNISFGPLKTYIIGRKESDLCLDDKKISKNHLRLKREGKDLVARDLQSSNGTTFEGQKIEERTLIEGDELKIGSHILKFIKITYSPAIRPTTEPQPQSQPQSQPSLEPVHETEGEGFLFLINGKPSFKAIKDTYTFAAKNVKTFWQTIYLDIPVKESTKVLAATSLFYAGIANAIAWGNMSGTFLLGFTLLAIFCPLALAAVFSEFDDWHKANGSFAEYAAFTAYWYFLFLPFSLLFPIIGGGGAVAALIFLIWGTLSFERRFKPEKSKFMWLLVSFYLGSFFLFGSLLFKLFAKRNGNVL